MPALVIDASAALPWCFADEATEATNGLLARLQTGDEAVVPAHWPVEVANALRTATRRGRISSRDVQDFLKDLESLPIRIDATTRSLLRGRIYPLSERHNLTVYDAAYLELAIREHLPLATLDSDLQKAAHTAGVSLVWP
jgi:predicted nucleic acid-binding protein